MVLDFQLTAEDYRLAFHAHRERTLVTRWFWRTSYALLVIVLLMPLLRSSRDWHDFVVPILLLVVVLVIVVYLPHRVGRQMLTGKSAAAPRTVEITDQGIHTRTSVSEAQLHWDTLTNWIETRRVFVLYLSPVSFFPIPKRVMTTAQQDEFRAQLKEKVRK